MTSTLKRLFSKFIRCLKVHFVIYVLCHFLYFSVFQISLDHCIENIAVLCQCLYFSALQIYFHYGIE